MSACCATDAKSVHTLVARELPSTSSVNSFGEVHGVNTLRVQGRAILGGVISASDLGEIDPRRTTTLWARVGRVKWVPRAIRQCLLLRQDP